MTAMAVRVGYLSPRFLDVLLPGILLAIMEMPLQDYT